MEKADLGNFFDKKPPLYTSDIDFMENPLKTTSLMMPAVNA